MLSFNCRLFPWQSRDFELQVRRRVTEPLSDLSYFKGLCRVSVRRMMLDGCWDWNFLPAAKHPTDFEELVGVHWHLEALAASKGVHFIELIASIDLDIIRPQCPKSPWNLLSFSIPHTPYMSLGMNLLVLLPVYLHLQAHCRHLQLRLVPRIA